MATTILEIAQKLNISHITVSRVLNNKPNVSVSVGTRERVLQAAREMGYRPNLAARSLRDSRTNVIAVFGSPYAGIWLGIIQGMSRVLHARHYGLFYAISEIDEQDEPVIPSWRFDGAIVLQSPTAPTLRYLVDSGQPFVLVNEYIEGYSAILCDEADGVRLAMEHLWALGHRRIAYANATRWHLPHYSVSERYDAYLSFLAERGAASIAGHDLIWQHEDRAEFIRATIMARGATAVLAYDHFVAIRIMAAAHQLGLRIPQDFSLICFNDEFPVGEVWPGLTVVATEGEAMGKRGGELLLQYLDAPVSTPPTVVHLPMKLVVRDSTAPVCGSPE